MGLPAQLGPQLRVPGGGVQGYRGAPRQHDQRSGLGAPDAQARRGIRVSSALPPHRASPHREMASPHRDMISPHRELASPHRELNHPYRGSPHRELDSPHRELKGPYRELKSPHRELNSPHRDLGSPHRDLGSPHRDLTQRGIPLASLPPRNPKPSQEFF